MRPMRRGNSGKIVPGDFDSHIGPRAVVAQFPVKNRPETGSLPPRLFLASAGWSLARQKIVGEMPALSRRHGRACHRKSGLPDLRHLIVRNSGLPELRCHPRLCRLTKERRGCPAAQTSLRSLRQLDCVPGMTSRAHTEFASRRRAAFVIPIHFSNSQSSSFPRRIFCAQVFSPLLRQAPIEGWRSADPPPIHPHVAPGCPRSFDTFSFLLLHPLTSPLSSSGSIACNRDTA